MEFWEKTPAGKKCFRFGQNSFRFAAEAARRCAGFTDDEDDETITYDNRSCYNCRYRRWTTDSFECMKPYREVSENDNND